MDRSHGTDNAAARAQLTALLDRLTAADLERSLEDGWQVATALAHLAFWDRRAMLILERWQRGQPPPLDLPEWYDSDILNEAILPLWQALPPSEAARLARQSAAAVDQGVERTGESLAAAVMARDEAWLLQRYHHRREHIDQIEGMLGLR